MRNTLLVLLAVAVSLPSAMTSEPGEPPGACSDWAILDPTLSCIDFALFPCGLADCSFGTSITMDNEGNLFGSRSEAIGMCGNATLSRHEITRFDGHRLTVLAYAQDRCTAYGTSLVFEAISGGGTFDPVNGRLYVQVNVSCLVDGLDVPHEFCPYEIPGVPTKFTLLLEGFPTQVDVLKGQLSLDDDDEFEKDGDNESGVSGSTRESIGRPTSRPRAPDRSDSALEASPRVRVVELPMETGGAVVIDLLETDVLLGDTSWESEVFDTGSFADIAFQTSMEVESGSFVCRAVWQLTDDDPFLASPGSSMSFDAQSAPVKHSGMGRTQAPRSRISCFPNGEDSNIAVLQDVKVFLRREPQSGRLSSPSSRR